LETTRQAERLGTLNIEHRTLKIEPQSKEEEESEMNRRWTQMDVNFKSFKSLNKTTYKPSVVLFKNLKERKEKGGGRGELMADLACS
jgi:hypothetical protein